MNRNTVSLPILVTFAVTLSACGQKSEPPAETPAAEPAAAAEEAAAVLETVDIAPGLSADITKRGWGEKAEAGDLAEVHYTGWLFDESAPGNRGQKFDSSVDRGETFAFPLGAGRVIKGWDQGVAGMLVGEVRELKIAPEMGYGDRGAGAVIPPGATLLFEVELVNVVGPDADQ